MFFQQISEYEHYQPIQILHSVISAFVLHLRLVKRTEYPGGVYDKRPCLGEGFAKDKTYAFYIDTANDIEITDCSVQEDNFERPFGGMLKQINTQNVKIKN